MWLLKICLLPTEANEPIFGIIAESDDIRELINTRVALGKLGFVVYVQNKPLTS